MILLSEDGKTYVEINDIEELITRPGFQKSIDITKKKLKDIISTYRLPEKIQCGISSCHTKHNSGFLALVDGGEEICVGNICGKKHFGVDWTVAKDQHTRNLNSLRYRENIDKHKNVLSAFKVRIQNLRKNNYGSRDTYQQMNWWETKGFPDQPWKNLKQRAKHGNAEIKKVRIATEREIEIARETGAPVEFVDETEFIIRGLSAVNDYRKLRAVSRGLLENEINDFNSLQTDSLSFEELKYWNKWITKLPNKVDKLEAIFQECERFLASDNIVPVQQLKDKL